MTDTRAHRFGERLKALMEAKRLKNGDVAAAAGVDPVTVSQWRSGRQTPSLETVEKIAPLLGVDASDLYSGSERLRESLSAYVIDHDAGAAVALAVTSPDPWEPNPSLVKALPPRVYEIAIAYCRRLAAAGLPREEVEEAERLLIDEGYAKLNKRAKRVLTEDEQIELIDATWRIMREALSWRGLRA
jgi:transcriptional regulator with XRE-family HTH domain